MTLSTDLRLDAPAHHRMPLDQEGVDQYCIEQLIRHWIDSGAQWCIEMIGKYRPDLTAEQIEERISELCRLNEDAAHLALTGQQRAAEHALDLYASALCQFAAKPDDLYSLAEGLVEGLPSGERAKLRAVKS